MGSPEIGQFPQYPHCPCWIVLGHDDDWVVGIGVVAEPFVEPGIEDGREGEVRLLCVHDHGAGVDAGFYCIGLQDREAERVDRACCQLAQLLLPLAQPHLLLFGRCGGPEGGQEVVRHRAVDQCVGKSLDPSAKLRRCALRERDGSDARWWFVIGQEHNHTAGEQRRLAGSSRRLDQ